MTERNVGFAAGEKIWCDGDLIAIEDATVHVMANVVARGTQVFDVLVVTRTEAGPAVVGLDEHLTRFGESAAEMGMEEMPDLATLRQAVASVLRANLDPGSTNSYIVKVMACWNDMALGAVPDSLTPTVYVATLATDEDRLPRTPDGPISVRTSDMPKTPATILPPSIKVAASYTAAIRQQIMSQRLGFDHSLFRTIDGFLAESMTSSVFVVSEGRLVVPPLDVVLNGVTRRVVLDTAEACRLPVEVAPVPWATVETADEIFTSSTVHPVTPVARLDDRTLETPGPVSAELAQTITEVYLGNHPLSQRWLTNVESIS